MTPQKSGLFLFGSKVHRNDHGKDLAICFFLVFDSLTYKGSLPNATFGPGKKWHKPKIVLCKYLANAIFG